MMLWGYGVTTVPQRRDGLLPRTLASLAVGGFDKPRLFVDGDDNPLSWKTRFGLEVTARYPAIRCFGNWALALGELYIREPHADRYAIFQDDLVTSRNLKAYLEVMPYPERGYCNLYTFRDNEPIIAGKPLGWHQSKRVDMRSEMQTGRGAVALVFDRAAVCALLSSSTFVKRPQDQQMGWRKIDGGIVDAMNLAGFREYVHNPSLVQHTGNTSTMRPATAKPHILAKTFPGEGFDALELLKEAGGPRRSG